MPSSISWHLISTHMFAFCIQYMKELELWNRKQASIFRLLYFSTEMRKIIKSAFPKLKLFHLASYSHWELIDKGNVLGYFELGQTSQTVLLERLLCY